MNRVRTVYGVDLLFTDDAELKHSERVMKYGAKILAGPMGSVVNPHYRPQSEAVRTCSNCGAPSAPGECRYCHEVVKETSCFAGILTTTGLSVCVAGGFYD